MGARIASVADFLRLDLRIPNYQRPYRWSTTNVSELLSDIDSCLRKDSGFKYRIGSVILHRHDEGTFDLVDGQQRALSLLLLWLCLDSGEQLPLLASTKFSNRETQRNLKANYDFIEEWIGYQRSDWKREALKAFEVVLEVVIIEVERIEEAFQLFDSQNTRGKALDPHDLLKAYHLRAMRDRPHEMRHAVTRWEEFSSDDVRSIFSERLFPICNWMKKMKAPRFTAKEIATFKGVDGESGYSYAARARRASPCFQVGEPFVEGEDFFLMSEHYLQLREDIDYEFAHGQEFEEIRGIIAAHDRPTLGFSYAKWLYDCVLFAYYDRFHNFDERAVRKLFVWAMMIRVDMTTLGPASIEKYAVGEENGMFKNVIPMFSEIASARKHSDIANLLIVVGDKPSGQTGNAMQERQRLWDEVSQLSKGGAR